jgi:GDP-L-fucose synthase
VNRDSRVFIAGHRGLVGSALVRRLNNDGFTNIITRTRTELDLTDRAAVDEFFATTRPEYVIVAAAKVGGILANNTYPADFLRDNLAIALNVIDAAYNADVEKLLFLSSSCVYPKFAPQPMKEEHLLTGTLEPTNEPYAVAKIAGMKLCETYHRQYGARFFSALPTNLYGPNDNFDLQNSHVLPALIRKFHEAKASADPYVTIWGSGTPRREFMHVDDLADACVFLMQNYEGADPVNIGVGDDLPISELAVHIAHVTDYDGKVTYDASKPDGTPRKLLDVSRLRNLGWQARIPLREGLEQTYRWYLDQQVATIQ